MSHEKSMYRPRRVRMAQSHLNASGAYEKVFSYFVCLPSVGNRMMNGLNKQCKRRVCSAGGIE
jgi:hypothetical protein